MMSTSCPVRHSSLFRFGPWEPFNLAMSVFFVAVVTNEDSQRMIPSLCFLKIGKEWKSRGYYVTGKPTCLSLQ